MSGELLATGLILASAIMHASSSAFFRADGDRLVRSSVMAWVSMCIGLVLTTQAPLPSPEIWGYLIGSSLLMLVFNISVYKSLEYGSLGFIYPISRGVGPVGVGFLLYFLFDQSLGLATVIGVGLVCAGIAEMALRGMRETDNKGNVKKALGFSILTGCLIACYTVIDARAIKMVDHPLTYVAWIYVLFGLNIALYTVAMRRGRYFALIKPELRYGLPASILGALSYGSAIMAFRYGGAVEIAALRESSIMFSVFIGWLFLGEGIGPRRLISAAMIATGAIVIKAF